MYMNFSFSQYIVIYTTIISVPMVIGNYSLDTMVLRATIKKIRALLTGPHFSQSGTLALYLTATLSSLRTMTLAVRDRHCILHQSSFLEAVSSNSSFKGTERSVRSIYTKLHL